MVDENFFALLPDPWLVLLVQLVNESLQLIRSFECFQNSVTPAIRFFKYVAAIFFFMADHALFCLKCFPGFSINK